MSAPQQMVKAVDGAAVGTMLATLVGWLPSIAAIFTIIWTAIRIYETDTVQRILGKRGRRKED